MANKPNPIIQGAVEAHVARCQEMINAHYAKEFPKSTPPLLAITYSHRVPRAKIVSDGKSVFSFIDLTNGDVLFPSCWDRPAPHARGNVLDDHQGMSQMTPFGPKSLN